MLARWEHNGRAQLDGVDETEQAWRLAHPPRAGTEAAPQRPPGFALPHARDKEKTHHTQASLPVKTRLRGKDELPQTERPPTSSPVVLPSMKMGGQTMSMLYWMWSSRSPPSWPSS